MKHVLTIILLITSLTTFGQNKDLFGKYTQSFFMYDFFLTLKDSSQFVIDEQTDLGSKTIIGTWTFSRDTIKLEPVRIWHVRRPSQEKNEMPIYIKEVLVTVDSQRRLKIVAPKGDMTYTNKELQKIK